MPPACPPPASTRWCAPAIVPMRRPTVRSRWRSRSASNPREVAEAVVATGLLDAVCSNVEVAGPGFINLTFTPQFLAAQLVDAAADPHLGVRDAVARGGRGRLLGAERGQGDARRPPAHHGHRRRARAHARVRRPHGHPREPHRRLGHAVRHAHRAPGRPRRRRRRARPSDLSDPSAFYQAGPRQVRRERRVQGARPRTASRCCRAATTPPRWPSGSKLVDQSRRLLRRGVRQARRAAAPRRHRRRELLPTVDAGGARAARRGRPARRERRRQGGVGARASPTARASRCRSSCRPAPAASTTPPATSPA